MAQSQHSENTDWYKAVRKLKWGFLSKFNTAFIAKVVNYDEKKHVASILPLAESSSGEVSAQYLDVPVSENCYMIDEILERLKPELEKLDSHVNFNLNLTGKLPKKRLMRKGVPVVAVVLDRDNDNWKGGRATNTYMPNSSRLHDANDAIIIGVLGGDAKNG